MIVYNPTETMESEAIQATLLWASGKSEPIPGSEKAAFARILIQRIATLF
jgi:hypothetical protein